MNNKRELGKYLRELREKEYKIRTVFAEKIDIPSQQIYDYEVGKTWPSINILIKLYNFLNKSFEELLKPLLDLPETSTQTASLIHRLKNVCKNNRNINKISGFLSSLEQEVEGGDTQRKIPNAKREEGRETSMGAEE